MAKSLLIRNVDEDAINWLEASIPAGITREKYLKGILENARRESEGGTKSAKKKILQRPA